MGRRPQRPRSTRTARPASLPFDARPSTRYSPHAPAERLDARCRQPAPLGGSRRSLPGTGTRVTPFYIAGALLVVAQVLGIYALVTRRADFIFALIMVVLLLGALAAGADGLYAQLH